MMKNIAALLEKFERSPIGIVIQGLKEGQALWLSELRSRRKGMGLIMAPSSEVAEKLYQDILFFRPELSSEITLYPAWEPHPFDTYSPHPDVVMARLEVLYRLLHSPTLWVITTVEGVMQKVIPREELIQRPLGLKLKSEIDLEALSMHLSQGGYQRVSTVEDRGSYAIRGGIVDIFPPLLKKPVRFELLGDEIETIRQFDPVTQRTDPSHPHEGGNLSGDVILLPVREVIFSKKALERAGDSIKERADEIGVPKASRDQILEYLNQEIFFSGIDYMLPFFYEKLDSFFDYFPEQFDLLLFDKEQIITGAQDFEAECHQDYERAIKKKRIAATVDEFYSSSSDFLRSFERQKSWKTVSFQVETHEDVQGQLKSVKKTSLEALKPLAQKIKSWRDSGDTLFFVAHTQVQQKRFRELMEPYGLQFLRIEESFDLGKALQIQKEESLKRYHGFLVSGDLSKGFKDHDLKLVFLTEEEVFGSRRKKVTPLAPKESFITSLSELKAGDPIVHMDCGVGRYQGLERLTIDGIQNDYLLLEYLDQDKLYLPVHRLNVVQKYVGREEGAVRLDKLGGAGWQKLKSRVKKAIQDIAYELLDIYAARKAYVGYAFQPPDPYFHEFEATFPYDETPDQLRTIDEVMSDLCSPQPMDRVVCGDVGYGKTEVAIRAAFKVVEDHKQVALLAPTTLLVDQHYRVFKRRLETFPVKVEMLSRFVSKSHQKKIISEIKEGKVDIVIGTHRLLSSDIDFSDLGLLIIDEEQRFGVKHKEKIKKLKKRLDVLTLSATPIPRTLHMALLGIRDLSIINTPPQDRRAIRTYISHFEDEIIRQAILKEIKRGGQVFFVHNRVQTIAGMAKQIETLVPEAKIQFAHGQMKESTLEKVMVDFVDQKFNVLVCTTIIGNGIDISTANTMIVDRADTFGLATLYQLRGRVGRSHERAYAYLLIPSEERLSPDAKKRLQVIQGASELGAGFKIAHHDLEIRGGGNILGKNQSGHIEAVGFELYTELLEQTIREMKGEDVREIPEPDLNLKVSAYIPQDYMPDPADKLAFYRELSSLTAEEDLSPIEENMRDRFGMLPLEIYHLFEVMAIKLYLKKLGVKAIDFGNQKAVLTFSDLTRVPSEKIIEKVKQDPITYSLREPNKFVMKCKTWQDILPTVRQFSGEWLKGEI